MRTRPGFPVLSTALAGVMTIFIVGCNKPPEMAATPPPTAAAATPPPTPSTTVGTEIDDSVITARVKSALLADPDVKGIDFKVETRKGEVQLSGFVESQSQIDRATVITRKVAGVKSVATNVSLQGAPRTIGNKVDDGIVTSRVKAALLADANIKSFDIGVVTRRGEVQLSGFVDNQGQIDRALEVARGTQDVSSVSNEMSIKK